MIILWGFKTKRKQIGETNTKWECKKCGHFDYWPVVKDRKWFTLFWIPLIPLNATRNVVCPSCGSMLRINSKNEEEILPLLQIDE